MSERIWLITGNRPCSGTSRITHTALLGASRGLGLTLTRRVLARGDRVIATSRNIAAFDGLLADPDIDASHVFPLRLDVTDTPENLRKVMDEAVAHWGRVDVLVNNAGTREISIVEEAECVICPSESKMVAVVSLTKGANSPDDFMIVAKTNYFGVINVTNALLPHLRARRSGLIIVIGTRSVFRDEIPVRCLSVRLTKPAAKSAAISRVSVRYQPAIGGFVVLTFCSSLHVDQSSSA